MKIRNVVVCLWVVGAGCGGEVVRDVDPDLGEVVFADDQGAGVDAGVDMSAMDLDLGHDEPDASIDMSADIEPDMRLEEDMGSAMCAPGEFVGASGDCIQCDAARGLFERELVVDGEARQYVVYVPESVDCASAAPLWFHFHGTATQRPEVAYQLEATRRAADRAGAILVRPRSRSLNSQGTTIYQWDANPGDVEKNIAFTLQLIEQLESTYHLSSERRLASGFSSGSNMAALFLTLDASPFTRLAPLAGGLWSRSVDEIEPGSGVEHVLLSTGTRDYLYPAAARTLGALGGSTISAVLVPSLSGHEFHDWEVLELERLLEPAPALATSNTPHVIDVLRADRGDVFVAYSDGGLVRRDSAGVEATVAAAAGGEVFTDLCELGNGDVLASTLSSYVIVAADTPGIATLTPWPAPTHSIYGVPYQMGVACHGDEVLVTGYWSAAWSDDAASTFSSLELLIQTFKAQVADAIKLGDEWITFGYYNTHRGTPQMGMSPIVPGVDGWLNGGFALDSTSAMLVGNAGKIARVGPGATTIERGPVDDLYHGVVCDGQVFLAGRQGVYAEAGGGFERVWDGFAARIVCSPGGLTVYGVGEPVVIATSSSL